MAPDPISISSSTDASRETIDRATAALAAGQAIAMPTETCYGLAVRADSPEAQVRLAELKGRPSEQAFTWHLGQASDLPIPSAFGALIARLADQYWPGPLTMVLPTAWLPGVAGPESNGKVGVRVPQHVGTQSILSACDFPIVMTSANPHGVQPFTDAQQIALHFGEALALVLDGGTSTNPSSTVLGIDSGQFEILRSGQVALEDLRQTAGLGILFVCTGNTCRSPMAEALAKRALRQTLGVQGEGVQSLDIESFGFHVGSAGVYAMPGAPASDNSITALKDWDIELSHASRTIENALERSVDRIYCLTQSHQQALIAAVGSELPQCELLHPGGENIIDPFGGPLALYRTTRDAIQAAIESRLPEWIG